MTPHDDEQLRPAPRHDPGRAPWSAEQVVPDRDHGAGPVVDDPSAATVEMAVGRLGLRLP